MFFENTSCGLPEIPSLSYDFVSSCYSSSSSLPLFGTFPDYGNTLVPMFVPPRGTPGFNLTVERGNFCDELSLTSSSSYYDCPIGRQAFFMNLVIPPARTKLVANAIHTLDTFDISVENSGECEDCSPSLNVAVPCPEVTAEACGGGAYFVSSNGINESKTNCVSTLHLTIPSPIITADGAITVSETAETPTVVVTSTRQHASESGDCINARWGWDLNFDITLPKIEGEAPEESSSSSVSYSEFTCTPMCETLPTAALTRSATGCTSGMPNAFKMYIGGREIVMTWKTTNTWESTDATIKCGGTDLASIFQIKVTSCTTGITLVLNHGRTWYQRHGGLNPRLGVVLTKGPGTFWCENLPKHIAICPVIPS